MQNSIFGKICCELEVVSRLVFMTLYSPEKVGNIKLYSSVFQQITPHNLFRFTATKIGYSIEIPKFFRGKYYKNPHFPLEIIEKHQQA